MVNDSTITNKKLFFTIPIFFGYADGMKIDTSGNIYCTCSNAVWIISPAGEQIGKIELPVNKSASNCTWGDNDRKTLFITAGKSVYKIRPLLTGIKNQSSTLPEKILLYQNYPNPFNPSTSISFNIATNGLVKLNIYDSIGKLVKTLVNDKNAAGNYSVMWNGKDNSGNNVSNGVYYYRLSFSNS
ncbi:MAG: SMP-30/gluconolactonase/LRE family protein [Ignavibacteriae bacterium]|nr:SMP-30/gluconolactonase/LRE family protein [Ignavibacteriota bacterium]